jgi:uncharacterized membrane protein YfcA
MDHWSSYFLLFGVGSVAGVLNVVAGGGSFLTLPVLIFLGLPPTVANGTNRVAIALQNVGAVWSFRRHGMIDWSYLLWAALPATVGAVLGTSAALWVGDELFQRILAILMVAVTLWTLWDPLKKMQPSAAGFPKTPVVATLAVGFFFSGVYGGFVQAGVGFLILATTSLAGLDLVRGNAVKVLSVLDKVHWWIGLTLGAGTVLGGLVGVKLAVLKGHAWIKSVVTVTIIVFALTLWFG